MKNLVVLAVLVTLALSSSALGEQPVRFAIIGDRTGGHEPGVYGSILQEINDLRPEFIMTVGDMIEGYTKDTIQLKGEWEEYLDIIRYSQAPMYHVAGNHDITYPSMEYLYRRYIGPSHYSFDHRGLHVIVLDNSAGMGGDPVPMNEKQLEWLQSDLTSHEDAACTMVFCHKPFWYRTLGAGARSELHDILVAGGVDAVFTGHFHRYFSGTYEGIKYTSIGSSGGGYEDTPLDIGYQFAWVTVADTVISIAPIEIGSVYPWDYVSTEEVLLMSALKRRGLQFEAPTIVNVDHERDEGLAVVIVSNLHQATVLSDTMTWEVPAGWQVQPGRQPVTLLPGESQSFEFAVSRSGDIYPAPQVHLRMPLMDSTYCPVSKPLWIGRVAECSHIGRPPKIDGELTEDIWKGTAEHRWFEPAGLESPVDITQFFFAWDEDNLYLAARCQDAHPDSIVASVTERDGAVFAEDCVGYFLAPDPTGETVFQIYVNPRGTVFDQRIDWNETDWYDTDSDFDGRYDVAASIGEAGWTVEMRIPLVELGAQIAPDDEWGLNCRRKQKRIGSSGDWLVPIDYAPRTYGRLVVGK